MRNSQLLLRFYAFYTVSFYSKSARKSTNNTVCQTFALIIHETLLEIYYNCIVWEIPIVFVNLHPQRHDIVLRYVQVLRKTGESQRPFMSFFRNSNWLMHTALASLNSSFIASIFREKSFLKESVDEVEIKSGEISKLGLKIQPISICVL